MRTSRRRVVATYDEQDGDAGSQDEQEWEPSTAVAAAAAARGSRPSRDGDRGTSADAAMARTTTGAAGSSGGGGGSQHLSSAGLEEWEEAELLALLSPESQKRERRRIANRDCARRIRQRKTELAAELTATVEQLQADNARLLATLTDVTRCWRDTTIENCELRAQLTLLQAGGSGGSRSSGGTGGDSGLPSPVGLALQLGSPGWPSPMAL